MVSLLKAFYNDLPNHFENIIRNGVFIGYKCLECEKMICAGRTCRGNHYKVHLRRKDNAT
jgi:hypothetical protein